MWIFLLLFSVCVFSMGKENSVVVKVNSASAATAAASSSSSSSSIDSFSSPEEKEDLYLRALYTVYPAGYDEINEKLKSYLDKIVLHDRAIVDDDNLNESNVAVLRRLRSGDLHERHELYIKNLVMKATSQAFEEQQEKLELQGKKVEEQRRKLESKFSKSSTAIIALVSSVVTSVTSVLIAVYSQK